MKKMIAVSIVLAVALLVIFAWLLDSEEAEPTTETITINSLLVDLTPEQVDPAPAPPPAAPETPEPATDSTPAPPAPDVTPTETVTGSITGRVFDQIKQTGLQGALITASLDTSGQGFTALTDRRGAYKMTDLPPGAYTVTCAEIDGYKETEGGRLQKKTALSEEADASAIVDFAISRSSVLTGRILVNGTPMPNTTMKLDSSTRLQFSEITTNENGVYRVETPADFAATIRGHLTLLNAVRATPYVHVRIAAGEEETVDFEFLLGNGSIEGMVLFHESDGTIRPVSGKLVATYLILDEHSNNRENMEAFTADDGSFLVEGLRAGEINLGLYPNARGIHRHRTTLILGEGEHARHDFHLYDTTIRATVENIPEVTQSVWVTAFKGEVPLPETLDLDFHAFLLADQVAVGGVLEDGIGGGVGTIGGLPPGRYTIIACGLPTYPHSLSYQAMGDDFYRLYRATYAYVTLPEDQNEATVDLIFANEQ